MFDKTGKDAWIKLIGVLLALSAAIMVLSIFTSDNDGRRQIVDGD